VLAIGEVIANDPVNGFAVQISPLQKHYERTMCEVSSQISGGFEGGISSGPEALRYYHL